MGTVPIKLSIFSRNQVQGGAKTVTFVGDGGNIL